MYIYKWIEGENNLDEYCMKRFGERPRFIENTGKVGADARIYKRYVEKDQDRYAQMFLLFMPHEKGTVTDISSINFMTYEEIKADRTAILI